MGAGIIGLEADIGYGPDFFGKTDAGGSSVLTVTGNLLVGIPFGASVPALECARTGWWERGWIRPDGDAFPTLGAFGENKLTWDFGGGLFVFFATHVGMRAEVRYFRTFEAVEFFDIDIGDERGDLDFTRGTIGFVLRF